MFPILTFSLVETRVEIEVDTIGTELSIKHPLSLHNSNQAHLFSLERKFNLLIFHFYMISNSISNPIGITLKVDFVCKV